MKIYLFNFETGEYIGEDNAQSCQLNEQDFILPCNATTVKPPKLKARQMAVFERENQHWVVKRDVRGLYWDKTTKQVVEVTDITHNLYNLTDKPPIDDEWCCWSEERQVWFVDNESKNQSALDSRIAEAKQVIIENEFRWTNQIRWNNYTPEQREKVSAFYYALLEVINQAENGNLIDLPKLAN